MNKAQTSTVGSDLKLVSATRSTEKEETLQSERTLSPHDTKIIELMELLGSIDMLKPLQPATPSDQLVLFSGSVRFIDNSHFQLMNLAMSVLGNESKAPEGFTPKTFSDYKKIVKTISEKFDAPAAFYASADDGYLCGGIIKEYFLDAPIKSYVMYNSGIGLSNMGILGIQHSSTAGRFDFPAGSMFMGSEMFYQNLNNMFFPTSVLRVTPILIYRKLENSTDGITLTP